MHSRSDSSLSGYSSLSVFSSMQVSHDFLCFIKDYCDKQDFLIHIFVMCILKVILAPAACETNILCYKCHTG